MTNDELFAAICEFPGGDDFLEGYILGIGFTATDTEGDSWFDAGPGEFTDYVGVEEITEALGEDGMTRVLTDALEFLKLASVLLDGEDMKQAGIDFHLTRNRHGAGFWDGDWPGKGDELTDIAHGFGELEFYDGYYE